MGAFYRHHGTCSQTFRKYYNRYQAGGRAEDLMPRKRGPQWKTRRLSPAIEAEIAAARRLGLNRYEIYAVLKERRPDPPSLSSIYRALKRAGLNRRDKPMLEEKRRIIKTRLGELGHADLHRLSRRIFLDPPPGEAYLIGLVCSCSRLAWAEIVIGKKALPVMFRTLKALNVLNQRYGLVFKEMLTDNGAEFASRANPDHPFEPCSPSSASSTATPAPTAPRPTARWSVSGGRSKTSSSTGRPSTISPTSPTNCSTT